MSGFFVVRRTFLDRVVRNLYGRGFKILLDSDRRRARQNTHRRSCPIGCEAGRTGNSKLGARVVAEFFMLLLYHFMGRLLPARFFLFAAVGRDRCRRAPLRALAAFALSGNFLLSQAVATLAAMTSNFFFNNVFTYGDQRLRGRAMWRGLLQLLRRLRASARSSTSRSPNGCSSNPCPTGSRPGSAAPRSPRYGTLPPGLLHLGGSSAARR